MRCLISLLLISAFAFGGCAKNKKKKDDPARTDETKLEESSDVDFHAFLGRLRKAVSVHDMDTIATMMTTDFGYQLQPELAGPGVFQYWDEHGLWPELEGILSEKFVKKGAFMVAPPQFADETLHYDGYRAGIRRVNGSWKFAYFVNGSGES